MDTSPCLKTCQVCTPNLYILYKYTSGSPKTKWNGAAQGKPDPNRMEWRTFSDSPCHSNWYGHSIHLSPVKWNGQTKWQNNGHVKPNGQTNGA